MGAWHHSYKACQRIQAHKALKGTYQEEEGPEGVLGGQMVVGSPTGVNEPHLSMSKFRTNEDRVHNE